MKVLKTIPFDAAEYLHDTKSQAELLNDAFESGDAGYIAHARGIVARARGMTQGAWTVDDTQARGKVRPGGASGGRLP